MKQINDPLSLQIWAYLDRMAIARGKDIIIISQDLWPDLSEKMKEFGLLMDRDSFMGESEESPREYMNRLMVFSRPNVMFWKERYKNQS